MVLAGERFSENAVDSPSAADLEPLRCGIEHALVTRLS
jgi:hypothetical protein